MCAIMNCLGDRGRRSLLSISYHSFNIYSGVIVSRVCMRDKLYVRPRQRGRHSSLFHLSIPLMIVSRVCMRTLRGGTVVSYWYVGVSGRQESGARGRSPETRHQRGPVGTRRTGGPEGVPGVSAHGGVFGCGGGGTAGRRRRGGGAPPRAGAAGPRAGSSRESAGAVAPSGQSSRGHVDAALGSGAEGMTCVV